MQLVERPRPPSSAAMSAARRSAIWCEDGRLRGHQPAPRRTRRRRSSCSRAAPEAMVVRRQLHALAQVIGATGDHQRGPGVEGHHVVSGAALLALEDAHDEGRVGLAVAALEGIRLRPRPARPPARSPCARSTPVGTDVVDDAPAVERQLVEPVAVDHEGPLRSPARGAPRPRTPRRPRSGTPTSWRRGRAGLARGPIMLKAVRTPSSMRTGPAWRMPGWKEGACR